MIAHKQKGSDQFMRISNNNIEYSRYKNFDLTRMSDSVFVIQLYQAATVDHI